jgi:hypothetical protein
MRRRRCGGIGGEGDDWLRGVVFFYVYEGEEQSGGECRCSQRLFYGRRFPPAVRPNRTRTIALFIVTEPK